MSLPELKQRAELLQELYRQEKELSENPAVVRMRIIRDLIRVLEPQDQQLQIPFSENGHTEKIRAKRTSGKIRYPGIMQVVVDCMRDLANNNHSEPDQYDYLDPIVDLAAEKYGVKGAKTLAHFRTCVYAALNKKNPLIEIASDEEGKRIYRAVVAAER